MRPTLVAAGVAVVLAGVLTVSVDAYTRRPPAIDPADPLGSLEGFTRRMPRVVGPRLSVPFRYQECRTALPRDGAIARAECERANTAAALPSSDEQLRNRTGTASIHTLALLDVLMDDGDGSLLARALDGFRRAIRVSGGSPDLHADLAAALILHAERTQTVVSLYEAVETAKLALEREPGHAQARYVLALALDRTALRAEARRAWQSYLEVDSTSEWADEARTRVAALSSWPRLPTLAPSATPEQVAAFARNAPGEARLMGWDSVLPAWGAAWTRGDSLRAAAELARAELLGGALASQGGDRTLADGTRAIRRHAASTSATRRLAQAHRAYGEAQRLYFAVRYSEARKAFETIDTHGLSSTLDLWAHLFSGAAAVQAGDARAGRARIEEVVRTADSIRHPAMWARSRWMLATTLNRAEAPGAASRLYAEASASFARLGEIEHQGATELNGGEAEQLLGRVPASLELLHRSLQTLRPYPGRWTRNALSMLALAALGDGFPHTATYFQAEADSITKRLAIPLYTVESATERARVLAARGRREEALRDLNAAERLLPELDPAGRNRLQQNVRYTRTLISLDARDPATVDSLTAVLRAFRASGVSTLWQVRTRLRRGDSYLEQGKLDEARSDVDSILVILHAQRKPGEAAATRRQTGGEARELAGRVSLALVQQGRSRDGLAVAERMAVALSAASDAATPLPVVVPRIPPGRVVARIAVVGDTVLTWVLRGGEVRAVAVHAPRAELLRASEAVREAFGRRDEAAAGPHLARLSAWLLRPMEAWLGPDETELVLLLDPELTGIPFGALRTGPRYGQRYLLAARPLRLGTTAAAASARPIHRVSPSRGAAFVADPAFDLLANPGVDRLPYAHREVAEAARAYGVGVVADKAARAGTVQRLLETSSVFHFAGHAVFDAERPERSYLLTAAEPGRGGGDRLTAADLQELDLDHVRLVVLSACTTLGASNGNGSGLAGLGGALLGAGVGGVVGSLWLVDDAATAELMAAFHREYRRTGDPAAALRTAQLHLVRSTNPRFRDPSAWAGFVYAGN